MLESTIGIIGDVVGSRSLESADRRELQLRLEETLAGINRSHESALLSNFLVTLGDEFQGLLSRASALPGILWDLENELLPVRLRLGVGRGDLDTELQKDAIAMDGPVWHRARRALDTAKSKRMPIVFIGFDDGDGDQILTGVAHILAFTRSGFTAAQRDVVTELRKDRTQEAIARDRGTTVQAVNRIAGQAGWHAYAAGERAWRLLLSSFDITGEGASE